MLQTKYAEGYNKIDLVYAKRLEIRLRIERIR